MPFLRIIRDKRGYETTYLMHWYREGHRQRSRILYMFRTLGGIRVGREALEPDVLRSIETQYPDIDFDWKTVIDNRQIVEPVPDLRRPRKRRRSEEETADVPPGAAASPAEARARPAAEVPAALRRPQIPSTIEGATPDEQIAFLTTWYPIVRERIPHRTGDPVRREALLVLAERLNAAAWTDADQIAAGLQQAPEALERLARVFSKRRRRSRRPSTRSASSGSTVSDVEPSTSSGRPELAEGRSSKSAAPSPGPEPTSSAVEPPADARADTPSSD